MLTRSKCPVALENIFLITVEEPLWPKTFWLWVLLRIESNRPRIPREHGPSREAIPLVLVILDQHGRGANLGNVRPPPEAFFYHGRDVMQPRPIRKLWQPLGILSTYYI